MILEQYIKNQKIELDIENKYHKELFVKLLDVKKKKFDEISDSSLKERILNCKLGSIILIYDNFVILVRRGKNNLNVMIPEQKLNNILLYLNKFYF